jgi:multidrug transporter EmrE-like cation transporter
MHISEIVMSGVAGLRDPRPMLFAIATGGFIAAHTVMDALGARATGTPHALYGLGLAPVGNPDGRYCPAAPTREARLSETAPGAPGFSGIMSYGSSWLIIWTLTLAPMALVSALGETSIVFAVIIGVVLLHERLSLVRLASIATTLNGTTVLKLSR